MKERPILFSAAMVQALLAGSKTQTRRIAKLVATLPDGGGWQALRKPGTHTCLPLVDGKFQWKPAAGDGWREYPNIGEYCPYGQVGDQLWVRETTCIAPKQFAFPDETCVKDYEGEWRYVSYKADGFAEDAMRDYGLKWTPSIHVPKWASRITLEITNVRCERLQDISESDAMAEGVHEFKCPQMSYFHSRKEAPTEDHFLIPGMAYMDLWNSINGPESWKSNPFVWVVEFRRSKP